MECSQPGKKWLRQQSSSLSIVDKAPIQKAAGREGFKAGYGDRDSSTR